MIVRVVAALTIVGWSIGGFVAVAGLGASLWAICAEDFFGVVKGLALVVWGVVTVQLALFASRLFVQTFALGARPNGTDG